MKLQTQIPLKKARKPIDYNSQLLLLGSCFVENMGRKLDYFKFRQLQNPFGILFHPLAVEKLVARAIQNNFYSESDIFYRNELWRCFDAHSDLNDTSKENLLKNLNEGLEATRSQIMSTSHTIITLGTAWVYRHKTSGNIVANCHKEPQREFSKELLSIHEIAKSLGRTINHVRSINQSIQFIFTVSPVRHLKDGFIENQHSKAHLISALHEVLKTQVTPSVRLSARADIDGTEKVGQAVGGYFPSYELMMDELREYRFYERDMVHPNQLAIDYIWEKFKQVWISEEAYSTMEKVDDLQKGLQHRPFNPGSEQHRKFLEILKSKMASVVHEYPFMQF